METNAAYLPINPDDLNIDNAYLEVDFEVKGYVLEDRDGDGVPETYIGWDFDNDGVADMVVYKPTSPNDRPEFGSVEPSGGEEQDPDDTKRPRATARVDLFGGGAAPARAAPAALPADDVTQALTDLKSLYDNGLMPDDQYEVMQGQVLSALDPQATGVEGGLQLLRDFWDQGLISADPYAAKRKEYLDAL